MKRVVITGATRTPIGSFGGVFKDTSAVTLAAAAIKEVLVRSKLQPHQVNEVIMGCVVQAGLGQNVARQAAIYAGVPHTIPAFTTNMACGSGLKNVALAAQIIRAGEEKIIVAGGMENMSQIPYLLPQMRWGARMGSGPVVDELVEGGLTDVFHKIHMGVTAENLATEFGISRQAQDQFAYQSQMKAQAAVSAGRFNAEVVGINVLEKKASKLVVMDEYPRPQTTLEEISKLRPAFKKDGGTVTSANSSGINDGAAAVVVMSLEQAQSLGVPILAEIVNYADGGVAPEIMGYGPVPAIKQVLAKSQLTLAQMDLVELNEAFAAQSLAVLKGLEREQLGVIAPERFNVNGGAIALGHPVGASGCRILVSLLYEMARRQANYGLAALCIGGGMGTSLIVKRYQA